MNNKNKIKKRYEELINQIEKYNYHYYNLDQPLVDDSEYDSLIRELIDIEKNNPDIKKSNSPSGRVGGFVSKVFSEAEHNPPMLSLGNIFTEADLLEFDQRCRKNVSKTEGLLYFAELKFDGLAVEAVYENGNFINGSTRGNGVIGEDITANLATLKDLPHTLISKEPLPAYLSVRGEVFLTHSEFEKLNIIKESAGETAFANPRNAAAGSLRQLNSEVTAGRDLKIYFYSIGKITAEKKINNQKEMFEYLKDLDLPISDITEFGGLKEIREFYNYWMDNRYSLDFDIDGIVVKISDFKFREKLGATSKNPRWATAWKFPAVEAVTVLDSVDFQVGRTGIITPVANLKPINIGGVLVKRATLYNFSEIKRLDLRNGDNVKVKRAGDVIPKVMDVITGKRPSNAKKITAPEKCPSCGSDLIKEDIYIRCVNKLCKAKKIEALKFFVSKDAMDIESFGPELVNRLYNAGKLKSISDIFKLTKEDLMEVERMGDKLALKVITSIESKKKITLSYLLKSLGIRNVGDHMAKVIARNVKKIDRLFEISKEELTSIKEVGPETADSIYNYFHDESSLKIVREIIRAGVIVSDEESQETISVVKDRTFVFTGAMQKLGRKEAEELVEKYGGNASSSVSSNTDYLVTGESPGSKYDKALKLGVKIISENDFLSMISKE